jgi:hypothetical protein
MLIWCGRAASLLTGFVVALLGALALSPTALITWLMLALFLGTLLAAAVYTARGGVTGLDGSTLGVSHRVAVAQWVR